MTDTIVTAEAGFAAAAVTELVELAEANGAEIELVKDDGAYLLTFAKDGSPATIVYADGHQPPPKSVDANFVPDDPWIVARAATETVFGGDDFAITFTPAEIRSALGPEGLRVRTTLEETPMPTELQGRDLWGRNDPIRHMVNLELVPAT